MNGNLESDATYYLRDGGPSNPVFYSVSKTANCQPVVNHDYVTDFIAESLILVSLALAFFSFGTRKKVKD